MVEFALVAPFFLLLTFLIIESALYMNGQATIDNASREGARVAAICGSRQSPFVDANGTYTGLPCTAAIKKAVQTNLGFLSFTQQNPVVIICTPSSAQQYCTTALDPVGGTCPVDGAGGWIAGGTGSAIEVDVKYEYDYYIGTFLGTGPDTCVISSARAVSQQ